MSYVNGNDDRWRITTWWPIVVTALAITVSAAQANTRLDSLADRITVIEEKGPSTVNERLARIETQQINIDKQLDRIEDKIDAELTVSPSTKKRLNRL